MLPAKHILEISLKRAGILLQIYIALESILEI